MNQNEVIRDLNNKISVMKEECTKELNEINYYYWPLIAKLKKAKKNRIWYVTLSCCLLAVVVVWLIFMEIVNEYWIGASLGLSSILILITAFRAVKVIREYNKANETWEKALTSPKNKQNEIIAQCKMATDLMLKEIADEEINKKVGDSYDDILQYYNNWVESN